MTTTTCEAVIIRDPDIGLRADLVLVGKLVEKAHSAPTALAVAPSILAIPPRAGRSGESRRENEGEKTVQY